MCFIRLENLVYQNNLTQSTEYYKADISKYISFSINVVLLKYQDPFIEYAISESCLSCSLLVWALNFSTIQWIVL